MKSISQSCVLCCVRRLCVLRDVACVSFYICLLSGFRLFSTSFPRGNTKKNKVHAHVQHERRKAKKLSPCVPYILFAFFWCRYGPVSGEGKKEENRTGGRYVVLFVGCVCVCDKIERRIGYILSSFTIYTHTNIGQIWLRTRKHAMC
jgi:hypothetical protein